MDIFEFIQKFFLILLPGVVGTYLYKLINIHKEEHYYFEILKLIMMSFISYLFTDILFYIIKKLFPCFIFNPIDIIQQIGSKNSFIPTSNAIISIIFSIIFACLFTKINYENWLFKLANKLKLTLRTDNNNVWEQIFRQNDIIVFRDFVTGNTYYGKVILYSDNSSNREIYFENVSVYDENSTLLYNAPQLYLSRLHNEFIIETPDDTE